ncbi:hypothetical protein COCSUDRAFT_61678 [Coccomyxa subellipsoidea C-169]|uniref:Uncharacterized protein n=1 Tax=Coccomyxa subellipsoidea (strain C-169) TaxID=574566 RepID=I0Z493_COCSC|nr:hypothetical protein COCSUDRAFT_61678 [Coccomyxa subellipsoidea C-169]EIE25462.1 hypothetical protein COCSUDRAFT_61678 [Coccomyxa subellipsoidea C-169]|eukprot:XP_005650006.1 hypothetical protein COCSUDRAFT_61678 [Coccomyxa subellipsoidea C-169]
MEHPEKRVPLLTSSTESFKIGLKSYAQLPGPKHGYSAGQDLSPVKSVRGAKATASTAQSAASFVVSAVAADTGVDTKCWMDGHEEEDTCTSGVSGVHARPLLETSRANTKGTTPSVAALKAPLSPQALPVDGAARILAANAVLLTPGQPTSDVTGGKKPSRARKGGSGDSGSARSADSAGSSGSSTKTSGRTQTIHKENCPWR